MFNALIALISTFLLGIVIYATLWWEGTGMSLTFTKWYFGIFFAAAMIVGGYTFFAS